MKMIYYSLFSKSVMLFATLNKNIKNEFPSEPKVILEHHDLLF